MVDQSVEGRLSSLEHAIQVLLPLPAEMKVLRREFDAFRVEMRTFTAEMLDFQALVVEHFTRIEKSIRDGDAETRRLIEQEIEETRRLLREGDDESRRLAREGDEETRHLMLALHREVMARFDALEGR